jgi:hypothetical protein
MRILRCALLFACLAAGQEPAVPPAAPRPLVNAGQPIAAPEWRVRADGPTQSFHIERRSGERWNSVAAFAVKLGACQPADAE